MNKVTVKTLLFIGFLLPQLSQSSAKKAALTAKPALQTVASKTPAAKPALKTIPSVTISINSNVIDVLLGSTKNSFLGLLS